MQKAATAEGLEQDDRQHAHPPVADPLSTVGMRLDSHVMITRPDDQCRPATRPVEQCCTDYKITALRRVFSEGPNGSSSIQPARGSIMREGAEMVKKQPSSHDEQTPPPSSSYKNKTVVHATSSSDWDRRFFVSPSSLQHDLFFGLHVRSRHDLYTVSQTLFSGYGALSPASRAILPSSTTIHAHNQSRWPSSWLQRAVTGPHIIILERQGRGWIVSSPAST